MNEKPSGLVIYSISSGADVLSRRIVLIAILLSEVGVMCSIRFAMFVADIKGGF